MKLPELTIEWISATSTSAMNAAVMAQDWQRDGEPLLTAGSDDLLCALLQLLDGNSAPSTARDIAEISAQHSLSSAFRRALRDLALIRRRIATHLLPGSEVRRLRRLRLHVFTPKDALKLRDGYSAAGPRLRQLQAFAGTGA